MIFGHEGNPRSGKSYEAVKYHVLEALKARRHVFIRLNGLIDNADKIAAHLEMDEAEVLALLHPMGNAEVHEWLVCDSENDGTLTFPHVPAQSLVVVDEAHEFWPVGRAALPDRVTNFFAKHGHISLDIVLMTQDLKELHRSIIRRMVKKNFYAKLDALGKDNSYSVRFYTAPLPGKWELVASEKREYDPAIFPMYHGIQPGVEGNAVYKAGTKNLWQAARQPLILFGIAAVAGVVVIARFFMGGAGIGEPAARSTPTAQATAPMTPKAVPAAVSNVMPAKPKPKYPAGIDYLLDIGKQARPRYAGSLESVHLLEFRTASGQVIERLTSDQVIALGWSVEVTPFGAVVRYLEEAMVFTSWPVDLPYQQSERTTQRIASAGPPALSASETQPVNAAPVVDQSSGGVAQVAAYGGFRKQ